MAKTAKQPVRSAPKGAKKPAPKGAKKPAAKAAKTLTPKGAKLKDAEAKAAKLKAAKAKPATKPKAEKGRRKSARLAASLPLPASLPAPQVLARPRALAAGAGALTPFAVAGAEASILDTLWKTVEARRAAGDIATSHSARLLARGTAKVAQKLGEEAVECVIEATLGNRAATVLESADLLYHLMVVWVDAGIAPEEVWAELARRQGISGIAEKASRPKALVRAAKTTKLP